VQDSARDEAAVFYRTEYPRLVGWLTLYVGDRCVAEELAQEAVLRALRRWRHVSGLESPGGWTWRVALNLANSTLRRRRAQGRAMRRLENEEADRDGRGDVASQVAVQRAVAALPDRQRTAVILRHYLDLSVQDTAARMGISHDAVRSLTKRGIAALRVRLDGRPLLEEVDDV
jgi:RNA polymerase sigma-70 factor (sigma-E family)